MQKTKLERVADIEAAIAKLKARRGTLMQAHKVQERKARTHRLCKRSGLLEKMLPDLATLSDEQFEIFVNMTLLTDFAENKLRKLLAVNKASETYQSNDGVPAQKEIKQSAEPVSVPGQAPQPKPTGNSYNGNNGGNYKQAHSSSGNNRAPGSESSNAASNHGNVT